MNTRGFHRPRIVRSAMAALLLTVATFGAARAADVHNLGRFTVAPIKSAPATTTLPPFNLTTAKSVDERLFILRVCNEIVGQLPAPNERSGELKAKLNWATQIATEFQTYAQSRHMDPLIINQFAGVIQMVDAYRRLMAGINEINVAAGRDSSNTVLDSISGGAQVAGKVHDAAKAQDATDRQADTFGVIIGLVAGIVNAENKNEQINADKREALDAEDREFEKSYRGFMADNAAAADGLSTKYGWSRMAVLFDVNNSRLAKWAETGQRARPITVFFGDPFEDIECLQQLADYAIKNGDQAEAKNISRRCMDEVSQVPEAVIFDKYRLRFLFTAASIANSAMTCGNGGLFSGPRDHDLGVYAVAVWDECLKRTDDPAGEFRERRAWALAYEGELDKAYAQASVPAVYNMRKDTTRYARAMAALQAQRAQLKAAWKWLRYDITTLHDTDTAWIRESSDFSPLRLDDKAAFDLLVPPSP